MILSWKSKFFACILWRELGRLEYAVSYGHQWHFCPKYFVNYYYFYKMSKFHHDTIEDNVVGNKKGTQVEILIF